MEFQRTWSSLPLHLKVNSLVAKMQIKELLDLHIQLFLQVFFFQIFFKEFFFIIRNVFQKFKKKKGKLPVLMDALVSAGAPDGFAVQLCDHSLNSDTKSGNMWIGGYDSSFISGDMVFASIVKQQFYNVQVKLIFFFFVYFIYLIEKSLLSFNSFFFPSN